MTSSVFMSPLIRPHVDVGDIIRSQGIEYEVYKIERNSDKPFFLRVYKHSYQKEPIVLERRERVGSYNYDSFTHGYYILVKSFVEYDPEQQADEEDDI